MTMTDRPRELPFSDYDFPVITADSHVEEPVDLLISRLPSDLRPEARHVEEIDGEKVIVNRGLAPISVSFSERYMSGDGTDERERAPEFLEREFRTDPSGGRDLGSRIKMIESDGVWGEVIFPNRNLGMGAHPNPHYQRAMARIHNEMLVDVFFSRKDRFAPSAVLPALDPQDASAEARWAKDKGFSSVMMPPSVPWRPYWLSDWEPLWSTVEEIGLPLNFHVFSGHLSQGADFANISVVPDELMTVARENFRSERVDERLSTTAMAMAAGMSPLTHLIGSGVLDRHPNLRFALVECEAGWIPWALQTLDAMQRRRRFGMVKMELRPSEYFHRQGWATFIEDKVAIDLLEYIGEDRLMWTNDWPHDEGTYLESREIIPRLLGHLPYKTQKKLLHDNAAALYGFA